MPRYYFEIFSPLTYQIALAAPPPYSAYKESLETTVQRMELGDVIIGYLTGLMRLVSLSVVTGAPGAKTEMLYGADDEYGRMVPVARKVFLSPEHALPIKSPLLWDTLSFTRGLDLNDGSWTHWVRRSYRELSALDGAALAGLLEAQNSTKKSYPLSKAEAKLLEQAQAPDDAGAPSVIIPDDEEAAQTEMGAQGQTEGQPNHRTSHTIQAELARIGERLKFQVWVPREDLSRVLELWQPKDGTLLEQLPFQFHNQTIKTVEHIDLLWVRDEAIEQAFEIEHTTAIYSGILRMADLVSLQPNININACIVAPFERREKVFEQILRPVFARLKPRALSTFCYYMSYESVADLAKEKLEYMTSAILSEHIERISP